MQESVGLPRDGGHRLRFLVEDVGSGTDVMAAAIAAVIVAWVGVGVVRGVIHNAGTVGISIAVVISTLQVKEKNTYFLRGRVERVGFITDSKRVVLRSSVKQAPRLTQKRVKASH